MAEMLKLYRGLSSSEFNIATDKVLKKNKKTWSLILKERAKGNFDYPENLNKNIVNLHTDLRLEYQYFTDSKTIATAYASKVSGTLIEISVSIKDLLQHFDIEFQNFGRRKKRFEIVYCVKGSLLAKYSKRWKLKKL